MKKRDSRGILQLVKDWKFNIREDSKSDEVEKNCKIAYNEMFGALNEYLKYEDKESEEFRGRLLGILDSQTRPDKEKMRKRINNMIDGERDRIIRLVTDLAKGYFGSKKEKAEILADLDRKDEEMRKKLAKG